MNANYELCAARVQHDPHEWRRGWGLLRHHCPGLVVGQCCQNFTHAPHWYGEMTDEWCNGLGLAGWCSHGVQMLNHCDECGVSA